MRRGYHRPHVTATAVRRPSSPISFLFYNQPDALIIQIYSVKLYMFQEFSTVHSALVSFVQVSNGRFQAESGWNCSSILTLLGSGHQKPA